MSRIAGRLSQLNGHRLSAASVQLGAGAASRENAPEAVDGLFWEADKDMRKSRVI